MSAIQNRHEFVYLFDVANGNPNGDPDAGNLPRLDPETNQGLVTDVCLKRKVRNLVQMEKDGKPGFGIYMAERAILNNQHKRAYDVRTFGAVMSTGYNAGQVRGPVQLAFARSIEPIVPLEISITRMAATTEEDAAGKGDIRTMGRKHVVPYGLYRAHGFVSAKLAERTGFSDEDLELFWYALQTMLDHDRSAARGEMAARRLIVFRHESALGNAPAHKLFDLVTVERRDKDEPAPARRYGDYEVSVGTPPSGVEVLELIQ
jgi:CRISPR-associated protein Csd2